MKLIDLVYGENFPTNESRVAIRSVESHETLQTVSTDVSYGQLFNNAKKICKILQDEKYDNNTTTEARQDIVAIFMPCSISLIASILGVLFSGDLFSPFDIHAPVKFNAGFFAQLKCKFVLVLKNDEAHVLAIIQHLKDIGILINAQFVTCLSGNHMNIVLWKLKFSSFISHAILDSNCDFVYVMHTSGSTGSPKNVFVTDESIVPNIQDFIRIFQVTDRDQIAMATAPTFDPFIIELFVALSCGAKIIMPSLAIKIIPAIMRKVLFIDNNVTILQCTPALLRQFTRDQHKQIIFHQNSTLRILALGGESCPNCSELCSIIHEEKIKKIEIYNLYGITEVSCWASCYRIPFEDMLRKDSNEIPLGNPLTDTTFQVCDDQGMVLLSVANENGKIVVRNFSSKNNVSGKLYIVTKQRKCFINDSDDSKSKVFTGDMVCAVVKDHMKVELFFQGRSYNIIKRNGKLVNLYEVKTAIENFALVELCNVIWVKNKLHAFIVKSKNCNETSFTEQRDFKNDITAIKQHLKMLLPLHFIPDHFIEIERMPVTSHGKINKEALIQMFNDGTGCENFKSVQDFLESLISEVLMTENIREFQSKSFLELGGDSLTAVKLIEKISTHFDFTKFSFDIMTVLFTDTLNKFISRFKNHEMQLQNVSKISVCENTTTKSEKLLRNDLKRRHNDSLVTTEVVKLLKYENGLDTNWKFDTGKCVDASSTLFRLNGKPVCFIGSHSHYFFCIDVESGSQVWRRKLGGRIESTACVTNCGRYVVVGCYDSYVYAMHTNTGEIHMKLMTGSQVKSSPCVNNDRSSSIIFIGSHDGSVRCIDIEEKSEVWKVNRKSGGIFSSPCHHAKSNRVYFCTVSGEVVSLCAVTGEQLWRVHLNKPVFSSPRACAIGVCVGCVDNKLYMLDHEEGQMLWSFEMSKPIFSSPCIHDDRVFVGSHDGHCYCVAVSNGILLWKSNNHNTPIYASPKYFIFKSTSMVTYASTAGQLVVASSVTGAVVATETLDGQLFSSPTIYHHGNDFVYILIGCRDDNVYCLQLSL